MAANVTVPPFTEAPETVVGPTPTSTFDFDFPFWSASDIIVLIDGVALDPGDYSVEGYYVQNGDAVEGGYGSGTVTLNTPVSNVTVTIDRLVVGSRESQFSRASPLPMPSLNAELNKLTARQQDLNRRALLTGPGQTAPTAAEVVAAVSIASSKADVSGANITDPASFRSALALQSMATQAADSVAVAGGEIGGSTGVRVATSELAPAVDFFAPTNWRAEHSFRTIGMGSHNGDARATAFIERTHEGSGALRPENADHGLFIKIKKTTSDVGESDGIYGFLDHQGGGDVAFLLGHVQKSGADGGAMGLELATIRLDEATRTIQTHRVHMYGPHAEANVTDFGSGVVLESKIGKVREAILIDTHDERPDGSTADPPEMLALLRARRNRTDEYLMIDGLGRIHQGLPADRIISAYDGMSHRLQQLASNGATGLTSLDQNGNYSVSGFLQGSALIVEPFSVATQPPAASTPNAYGTCIDGAAGAPCLCWSDGIVWRVAGNAMTAAISTA